MGFLAKFVAWLGEYEEPAATGRASGSDAPSSPGSTDHSDDSEHAINPATGLPLISGGLLDIGGSLFGTDSHSHDSSSDIHDMFGSDTFGNDW